jgi:PLAC8 family
MTRMNLTACGRPVTSYSRQSFLRPVPVMIMITAAVFVWSFIKQLIISSTSNQNEDGPNQNEDGPFFLIFLMVEIGIQIGLLYFILKVHTKTRNRLRRTYNIGADNGDHCLGDCCCAYWCGPCSICQMASHTADYRNTHRARCCTETGLDEDAEPLYPFHARPTAHVV